MNTCKHGNTGSCALCDNEDAEHDAAMAAQADDDLTALRRDAERWRAMREQLIAVDLAYGDPPMSIAVFLLQTGVVMAGPEGADAIADAAVAARGIGAA